jgi:hypothetical protein
MRSTSAVWMLIAVLWLFVAVWLFLPASLGTIEYAFSRGIYRINVAVMTTLTQWLPFPLTLMLMVVVFLGFPVLWGWQWRRLRRAGQSHAAGAWWGLRGLLILLPLIGVWFVLFWGAGYKRLPAEQRLALVPAPITTADMDALRAQCLEIIERDLPKSGARDADRAIAAISDAMREVVREWEGRGIVLPRRVKATPRGFLLANGTSGVCSPFTLEPNVDGGLPPTAFVYVAAHELGHVAGACMEDEATLLGFAAGLRAADPFARYAVALDIYTDLSTSYQQDLARLPQAAQDDLQAAREAVRRYRIDWFSGASRKVYNRYLQSQGVKDGMRSYGRGITLFISAVRNGKIRFPEHDSAPPSAG